MSGEAGAGVTDVRCTTAGPRARSMHGRSLPKTSSFRSCRTSRRSSSASRTELRERGIRRVRRYAAAQAPVAQWIEQRSPKARARVRLTPGASAGSAVALRLRDRRLVPAGTVVRARNRGVIVVGDEALVFQQQTVRLDVRIDAEVDVAARDRHVAVRPPDA